MISPQGIDARHPDGQYTRGAKLFHWLTIPPLAIILLSGLTIRFIGDEAKMAFYTLHESLGLLMFVFASLRLAWRLTHAPPAMATEILPLERLGAETVHRLFYVILIVQPVLGFFTTNALGFPQQGATAFLGLIDVPRFMAASPNLAETLHLAHSLVGWALCGLIPVHLAGVLGRHIVYGDGTLLRML